MGQAAAPDRQTNRRLVGVGALGSGIGQREQAVNDLGQRFRGVTANGVGGRRE